VSETLSVGIRPLDGRDLAAVLALTKLVPKAPWWNEEHVRQLIHSGSAGDDGPHFRRGWVAGTDHDTCGFLVLQAVRIVADVECEIESIVVHPAWRRRGIGRSLLETMADWCRQHGASVVRLEVRSGNAPAIQLYEAAGFVASGTRPRYYESPSEDALLMELRLVPTT
jgi:ribosomal-protein-alanine acetyltransferase